MSTEPAEDRAPATRHMVTTVGAFALAVIVLGTMLILANYTTTSTARTEARANELAARLDALTESQKLIAAQLAAQGTTTRTVVSNGDTRAAAAPAESPRTAVPFNRSAAESNMGVNVAVVRFKKAGAATQAGSAVTIQYGNYLDGMTAFNVAASRGDVFQGSYYVDASTMTVEARLLRTAAVTVYGWKSTDGTGTATSIVGADLAGAVRDGGSAGQRWRDAWFWIKIARHGEILAASETPPQ
jgi:hypothetical protein